MDSDEPNTATPIGTLVIAPLVQFSSDYEPLEVTGSTVIRLQTARERELLFDWFKPLYLLDLGLHESRFCFASIVPAGTPSPSTAENEFHRIISALRLHKRGNVSFNVIATWSSPHSDEGQPTFVWSLSASSRGPRYELNKSDLSEVSQLAGQLNNVQEDQHLMRVISRFEDTYNRSRAEDKLIDYWIALEALFSARGETTELAFKAALRIARYVGRTRREGNTTFQLIKKSYTMRSKIVHGEPAPSEVREITDQTEDILRRVVRAALQAGRVPDLDMLDADASGADLS